MHRTMASLGLGMIALIAWLLLADALGWLPPGVADAWIPVTLRSCGVCFAGAGILFLGGRAARGVRRGRCVRCGKRIEPGQTYCRDHLRAAVDEYRDRSREALRTPRRATRTT